MIGFSCKLKNGLLDGYTVVKLMRCGEVVRKRDNKISEILAKQRPAKKADKGAK